MLLTMTGTVLTMGPEWCSRWDRNGAHNEPEWVLTMGRNTHTDASGRLVEVVEPNPGGNGSVSSGGLVTTYAYNTLGNLTTVTQGSQPSLL